MTIVNLDEHRPHLSGMIKCLHCGNTWVGISPLGPVGVQEGLECHKCGLNKGFYRYPTFPPEDQQIFKCHCGGDLFFKQPEFYRCVQCGCKHTD